MKVKRKNNYIVIEGENNHIIIARAVFGFGFSTKKQKGKNWLWELHIPFILLFYYDYPY